MSDSDRSCMAVDPTSRHSILTQHHARCPDGVSRRLLKRDDLTGSSSIPGRDRSGVRTGGRSNVGRYTVDMAALSLVLAAIFAWGMISARAAAISTPIFFVAIGLIPRGGPQADRSYAGSRFDEDHRRGDACLGVVCRRQPRTFLGAARGPGALCPTTGDRSAPDNRVRNGGRRRSTRREAFGTRYSWVLPSPRLTQHLVRRSCRIGFGPCLDAAVSGQTIVVDMSDPDGAYPDFAAAVRGPGVTHSVSVGLLVPERSSGPWVAVAFGASPPPALAIEPISSSAASPPPAPVSTLCRPSHEPFFW